MTDITFKNVGQGDSILLEWLDANGNKRIAIIDIKRADKLNSVIKYIEEKKYTEIEFIILSHPHFDHYSGILDLLLFVEEFNIKVGWFGHTMDSRFINKEYWKLFETDRASILQLEKTLEKAIELKKKGTISSFELPFKNWHIPLSPTLSIRALSPSHEEIELYHKKVTLEPGLTKKDKSQAANLLSTVFKISNGDSHVLITSDAEGISLERMHNEKNFVDITFSLVQVPHHGAIKNYSKIFWDNIISKKVAVISAGHNLKYKHPDFEVLECLEKLKYTIHSTTICHGMIGFVAAKRKSLLLDMVSTIDEQSFIGGDKAFKF